MTPCPNYCWVWYVHAIRRAAPPTPVARMVAPMVARRVREPLDRAGWLCELKCDGFRAIAETESKGLQLYSRRHNDFTKRFPPIADALRELKTKAIFDGE